MLLGTNGGASAAAAGPTLPSDKLGTLITLDPFIVNLNEAKSTRYLKLTFAVELADESVQEVVEDRMALVRDRVLTYLTGLRVDDVRGEETKATIREMLRNRINEALNMEGGVRSVLFIDFVVQ